MAQLNPEPWRETAVVGEPIPRVDAYERLSGAAVYPLDVLLPDMLHAATLRCPHPHALVKKVDFDQALQMPGVRAVLSDADPDARIPWYSVRGGGAASRLFDPHCRFEGEEVAAVAADSPQQAWDAVRAIRVEYEGLPFVTNMEDALEPNAPAIQDGNRAAEPSLYSRGDVAEGFAEADVVLDETYRTSCEIHAPMEVHGSVAEWDGDRLTVWDTSQGPFAVQSSLAGLLAMPLNKVRVISQFMGGGFGSKLGLSKCTVIAALLARKTGRPVKLFLTREETFLCVGNRPAHSLTLKAGVKKDGALTALQLTGMGEVGAYPGSTTAGNQVRELYRCPNVRIEETSVLINAGQNRPMRAPGYVQCSWALEQMLDELAERIGMDPIELRIRNFTPVNQVQNDMPYTSAGLRECLTEGAKAFGWKEARDRAKGNGHVVRGVGVAGGMWGSAGGPPSTVIVSLYADGSANLNMGAADLGTGTKTVMAMIVAEELGLPLDRIRIEHADTGTTQYSAPSGGSKTVPSDSPAVRAAALDLKSKLLEMAAQQLNVPVEDLTVANGEIVASGGSQKVAFADLNGLRTQRVAVGVGVRHPNPTDKAARPFIAHFAEVEVNRRTGEARVMRLLGAQDSGRVLNLLTYRNQVFGGLTMGIGFAMTEQRVMDSPTGKMVNANWHDYKIPTAKDVPADLVCVPVDMHDTEWNTTGTKGIGEPATIPTAAAIANAFYNATGVRLRSAPMTLSKIVSLLSQAGTQE